MSIMWMDNFVSYGTGPSDIGSGGAARTRMGQGTPYVNLNSWTVADPVTTGGYCITANGVNNNGNNLDNNLALPVPGAAIGVACRFYLPYLGQSNDIIQWQDVSNNTLYAMNILSNGAIAIRNANGGNGAQVVSTIVPVVTAGAWWHIEAMVDLALGYVSVYVEGVRVIYQSIPTSATLIAILGWSTRWNLQAPITYQDMKDLIIYDKNGTVNNAAGSIGPVTVYRLPLLTDVSNGWTITGGTTVHATIGGEPPVDATEYSSAGYGPFPAAAVCGATALPANIVGVRGIMTLQRVDKSDGGDAQYQMQAISGTSTHTGVSHLPGTSLAYQYDVVELDPATGVVWSPIGVNNVHIGINRTV